MNFGVALALLKAGKRLSREGWNGKGMFIYLVGPGRYEPTTEAGLIIALDQPDGLVPYRPYLAIKGIDGLVAPWAPSQTDVLSEDWQLAQGETVDFATIEQACDEMTIEIEFQGDNDLLEIDLDFKIGGTA